MSQKPSEGNTSNGRYRTRKTRSKKKENKRLRVSSEDFSRDETPLAKRKAIRWTQDEWTDDSIPVATEDEQDIEDPAKICLAAAYQNGKLGCSYYDPAKRCLYILEDTLETSHFDLIKLVLEQAKPSVVLTSSKADDAFIDVLREQIDTSIVSFSIRPHKEFSSIKGRDRLLALRFLSAISSPDQDDETASASGENPKSAYDFMRRQAQPKNMDPTTMRWNASIRLSNFASLECCPLSLSSIGGLLDHLIRERARTELDPVDEGMLDVQEIEVLKLNEVMQINADALCSLQVFEQETHASVHNSYTKEGLSLFGILNSTRTNLGRSLLHTWLLRPSTSLVVITARLNAVSCFSRADNLSPCAAIHTYLATLKSIPPSLKRMRAGQASMSDWQGLVKFTVHVALIRDCLSELFESDEVEVIQKLIPALDVFEYNRVGTLVNETIDWQESAGSGRISVRYRVDEELDKKKEVYYGIDGILSKVAKKICDEMTNDYTSSLNVVYFPQLGFLICVPMTDGTHGMKIQSVRNGWTFQFSSEEQAYFKSQEMHDMDTHIGDLLPAIVDREIEIVQKLQETVLEQDQVMRNICDLCAELDVLLSFAEISKKFNYCRPIMVEEPLTKIEDGRHPLLEQLLDVFVPNSAMLLASIGAPLDDSEEKSEDQPRSIVLCTGANACGKSIYLKQIALIHIMAQIGCYVPASAAQLGVVDKIFTRIQTRESASTVQSAFMTDLNQVSLALRSSTVRSLILLDEFGKGTLSTDGAGLFWGVIKHLLARGAKCPRVVATTHFHDIFHSAQIDLTFLDHLTCIHMEVVLSRTDSDVHTLSGNTGASVRPGEKIAFLYRVAPGLALDSHAVQCAELFGLPQRIVERARYVSHLLASHDLEALLDEGMADEEVADLENAEVICKRFLALDFSNDREEFKDVIGIKTAIAEVLGRVSVS